MLCRELHEVEKQKEDFSESNQRHVLPKCAKAIKAHSLRICDRQTLKSITGFGEVTVKVPPLPLSIASRQSM